MRGWSAYYRTVVSSNAFKALDDYMGKLTYKWAKHGHQNKSRHWIVDRYFGRFNTSRQDRWVFGDQDTGAHLRKFSWTKIVRHQMVAGISSPDDPSLTAYWSERRRRGPPPPLDAFSLRMLKIQAGRCPLCGDFLLHADHQPQHPREWERWAMVTRRAITRHSLAVDRGRGTSDMAVRLVHASGRRRHHADQSGGPALQRLSAFEGLLEPDAVGAARPVRV